jgi:hypothetical protein
MHGGLGYVHRRDAVHTRPRRIIHGRAGFRIDRPVERDTEETGASDNRRQRPLVMI